MLGAIVGDVAGSAYEFNPYRGDWAAIELFPPRSKFTDDTVMTLAVAHALMGEDNEVASTQDEAAISERLIDAMHDYGSRYPRAGYGGRFGGWLRNGLRKPYNSFGNGSAMRVSSVGWLYNDLDTVERMAACTAAVTHNHPEGLKGAQATAGSIFLARQGKSKGEIRSYVADKYGYDMSRTLTEIQPKYKFNETCQGSVPEAITAFLESEDFAGAIRKAIWLGGDADTQAAIAGSIAEAFYGGVPEEIAQQTLGHLDNSLRQDYYAFEAWKRQQPGK